MGKKHTKKVKRMKEMDFETEKPVRLDAQPAGIEHDGMLFTEDDIQDMVDRKRQAKDQELMKREMALRSVEPVGQVMDGLFGDAGEVEDADVSRRAHELIEELGEGLFLGLNQWAIVQRIVVAALREDPLAL